MSKNIVITDCGDQAIHNCKKLHNMNDKHNVSLHNRSICWLCTLFTVMKLFLSVPLHGKNHCPLPSFIRLYSQWPERKQHKQKAA